MKNQAASTQLVPVTQWPLLHLWPLIGGLRHLIFHAKDNGFDQVIRRVGRRVLIDEAAFFEWASAKTTDIVHDDARSTATGKGAKK
jgi:hypothetical protein